MILRRRTTLRVPSGPIRTRSSSQPPCSARSTSSFRTTLREYSREKVTLSNSHSTPRAGGRRCSRLTSGSSVQATGRERSIGGHVVESGGDLGGQGEILDAESTTQLRRGPCADDRSG